MNIGDVYVGNGADAPEGTILSWFYSERYGAGENIAIKQDDEWWSPRIEDPYDLPYLLEMLPPVSIVTVIRWGA